MILLPAPSLHPFIFLAATTENLEMPTFFLPGKETDPSARMRKKKSKRIQKLLLGDCPGVPKLRHVPNYQYFRRVVFWFQIDLVVKNPARFCASQEMLSPGKGMEENGLSEIISKLHKIGLLCAETKVTVFTSKELGI